MNETQRISDETDIKIEMRKALTSLEPHELTFKFDEMDEFLCLEDGSTAKYIDLVATELGLEVINKGATRVELRKKPAPMFTRLQRG